MTLVLVDTSVWVDHLRRGEAALAALLEADRVLSHPFVLGELSLGRLRDPAAVLGALAELPQAVVATDAEVMAFIAAHGLAGSGIGYLDAHLLAATRLTRDARLWTRDRRLATVAERLGLAAMEA